MALTGAPSGGAPRPNGALWASVTSRNGGVSIRRLFSQMRYPLRLGLTACSLDAFAGRCESSVAARLEGVNFCIAWAGNYLRKRDCESTAARRGVALVRRGLVRRYLRFYEIQ